MIRFIISHHKLSPNAVDGIVDEQKLKMTKKELQKNQIVAFEFPYVKTVFASQLDKGKVTMLIQDSLNP